MRSSCHKNPQLMKVVSISEYLIFITFVISYFFVAKDAKNDSRLSKSSSAG